MTFQMLISAVNADNNLLKTMNMDCDGVLVNQCDRDGCSKVDLNGHSVNVINQNSRGVGLSRNTALLNATADICLFADEDIVYEPGVESKVLQSFEEHKDADLITFNVDVDERRRTYYNQDFHPITWRNYGRYPAYAIAIRRSSVIDNNIKFSELFGGGAKYSNGEDSLFLHDCLKAGLVMYADTPLLGKETYRESTWFKGYTEKFFFDRGVLYHFLYGRMALIFGLRFLIVKRKEMLKEMSFLKAFSILRKGIKEGKSI